MKKQTLKITQKGSLGLLAFGDIGFKEWRKVKGENKKNNKNNNKNVEKK